METKKVKLTEKQLQELDDQMYEIVRDRCDCKNSDWIEEDAEIEIDGVLYIIEYYGEYECWETRAADYWYGPAEYDESCYYRVNAFYYYDEETDERIDVETGRENGYKF